MLLVGCHEIKILGCLFCRLAFFKASYALFDSEFYVKADDDIYLRPGTFFFESILYNLYIHLSFLEILLH